MTSGDIVFFVVFGTMGLATIVAVLLRRHRARNRAQDEAWAIARMDELCPSGWQAQITVVSRRMGLPPDAPRIDGERPSVCVDWTEYTTSIGRDPEIAVSRRAWGTSIAGALRGMVADRTLDHTLEEIEAAVLCGEDGADRPL